MEGDRSREQSGQTPDNFYPRPPGGGRQAGPGQCHIARAISIHALRVEGDPPAFGMSSESRISIHALRVEGDLPEAPRRSKTSHFYPRPPGGGRLYLREPMAPRVCDFYPRPPGGGRRDAGERSHGVVYISIHALRVEGDTRMSSGLSNSTLFLSTPSGWRATLDLYRHVSAHRISIHALRVEGDTRYPRKPETLRRISIHALRVEGDTIYTMFVRISSISIHALRVEGDPSNPRFSGGQGRFLSTPSGWRATVRGCSHDMPPQNFYPRPPGGGRRTY